MLSIEVEIFIDFFEETAYNKSEQRNLLDLSALLLWVQTFNLSASQLKMRIVNFQGDKNLSPCFAILWRIKMDFYRINEEYNKFL